MSKAEQVSRKYQEQQRQAAKRRKEGWDYTHKKAVEAAGHVAMKTTWPAVLGTVNATTSNATTPITVASTNGSFLTVPANWFGSAIVTYPGNSYVSSGSITVYPEEATARPEQHPSDDVTRQMVERAVLAAIDRCLAADHYPKGIALTQTAHDALKGSPLVKSGYWQSPGYVTFLDLPMHIVEMIDPLDVEVGW